MTEIIIDREVLRAEMPEYAKNSTCECDRKEWLRAKMLDEMKKCFDEFCVSDRIPGKVTIVFE
jgi:hypothetical protein